MMKPFTYSKNYCMVCYKINDCSYIFVLLKSTVFNLTYFHMQVILKCLMTYKKKHLVQYHENFERLLNDATFKTELTMFGIDSENTIVKEEDRSTVMPILLRILYGQLNLMRVCLWQTRVMIVGCVY